MPGRLLAKINLDDVHLDQSLSAWDLAFAGVTLIATWIIGRLVGRAMRNLLGRLSGINDNVRRLTARIAKYFVWVVGVGIALSFLGAQIQPLLSAVLVIAVIAALALRGVAANFGAGLVLQSRRPIQIGDSIESLGYVGNVKAINGLSVVLETLDGQTVHLPNTEVLDNPIVNDSVNGRRRSDFEVRVAAGVERLDDVHGVVAQAIAATPAVDQAVRPQVTTAAIERGRLTLLVRLWHDPSHGRTVRSAAMHEIARALSERGLDATLQAPPPVAPLRPPAIV